MYYKKIIAVTLFVFLCSAVFSQTVGKLRMDYFEQAHQYGIPGVYDMFQDSTGLIWFGSTNGAYRYNGTDILEFTGEEKKVMGKTNYSFLQEKNGDVLIGSDYGVCRYKFKENKIELLIHLERPFDERNKYCLIGFDRNNYLWLSIAGVGLARYKNKLEFIDDKENKKYGKPDRLKQGYIDLENNLIYLSNHFASSVTLDLNTLKITPEKTPFHSTIKKIDQRLFFIYSDRIKTKHTKTGEEKTYLFPENARQKMGTLYAKACISDDNLWISGMYGVISFNCKENRFVDFFGFENDPKSPFLKLISELFTDRFGNVWVCSETDGIRLFNAFRQKRFQFADGASVNPMTVMDVEVINDTLLLACPLVSKPCLINLKSNSTLALTGFVEKEETFKVDKLNDSTCIISTVRNTAYLLHYRTLKISRVQCSDKNTNFLKLLVTASNSGYVLGVNRISKFNFANGRINLEKGVEIQNAFNFTLLHDPLNHVLIFSNRENSTVIDDTALTVIKKTTPLLGAFNGYEYGKDGSLWLATRQGLKHYDRRYHLIETFNSDNGFNNDVIYDLLFNKDSSQLYLSTNRGISALTVKTKQIKNYTTTDGIQESEHNTGASARGKNGGFYFGNIRGVTFFKEESLQSVPEMPILFVTNISVNDTDYYKQKNPQFIDTLILKPGANNFSLRYRIFQNSDPEKISYSYKLEGLDPNWEKNSTSPTINYSGLEPGKYQLKIRGRVDNLSIEKTLQIIVLPPFYQTWWFRIIAAIFVLFLLFLSSSLLAKARVRRKEKKLETERRLLEQKTQISRDLHDNVGARLSMMLNTMDWITKTKTFDSSVMSELQDNTKSVIQNLRETIWVMNKEEITVVELFDKIKTYALQFFKHYNTQVHFVENIGNDTSINSEQTLNLFRITQEVLNNILKYAGAELVNIEVSSTPERQLEINFSDNGVGFDMENYIAGNGILNMKERATEIAADFHMDSRPGKGTFIRIRLYSK